MALKVTREDVWAADLLDRPGGLAAKLGVLSEAGVNLEFGIARRAPDKPGHGVVFVTPLKGTKQFTAAQRAGFRKTKSLHGLRIEALDRAGLGRKITAAIAEAKINIRGYSAAAVGRRAVFHFAFDSAADATKASRVLKKMT